MNTKPSPTQRWNWLNRIGNFSFLKLTAMDTHELIYYVDGNLKASYGKSLSDCIINAMEAEDKLLKTT